MRHGRKLTREQLDSMSKNQVVNTCLRLQEKIALRDEILSQLLYGPPPCAVEQMNQAIPQSEDMTQEL